MAFGPDGYLYIGMGDGGGGGDPQDNAPGPDTLLGKMLRIDVNGTTAGQAVPASRPTTRSSAGGGATRSGRSGLRNPWRWSFDRATGDLWIGDVGQNAWEEVDVAAAVAAAGGVNYGWDGMEGTPLLRADVGLRDAGAEAAGRASTATRSAAR